MLKTFFYALGLLSLATYAQAQSFVGCVLAATLTLTASNGGRVANQAACNARCAAAYEYSYYTAGTTFGNNCYCDAEGSYTAASGYLVPAGGSGTACAPALQATATHLTTTFEFQNCVGTLTGVVVNLVQGTILGGSLVTSPGECFAQCRFSANAYVIPIVPSVTAILPSYGCVCAPSGEGPGILCGEAQFYKYNHPVAAAVSGIPRRRLQEAMEAASARRKSFCPGQTQACNVQGAEDSWECVDPSSELESCGGCPFGDYSSNHYNGTATGVDCTRLPGVRVGGATCTKGQCEVFSCKRGWTLVDGQCLRM